MADRKHLYSSSTTTYEMTVDGLSRKWLKSICVAHRKRLNIKDQDRKIPFTSSFSTCFPEQKPVLAPVHPAYTSRYAM